MVVNLLGADETKHISGALGRHELALVDNQVAQELTRFPDDCIRP